MKLRAAIFTREFLRDGLKIGVGQGIAIIGRMAGIKVLTSLLSPAAYGVLNLGQGLATLISNFFCAPIIHASIRFYPEAVQKDRLSEFKILLAQLMTRRIMLAVLLLAAAGGLWVSWNTSRMSVGFVIVLLIFLVIEVNRSLQSSLLNASRDQGKFAAWEAIDPWLKTVGAISIIYFYKPTPTAALIGIVLGTIIVFPFFQTFRPNHDLPELDQTWTARSKQEWRNYALPIMPLALLGWFMTYADRYFVGGILDLSEAGLYAASYGLGSQPFIALGGMINATFRPALFSAVAANDEQKVRMTLVGWLSIIAIGSAIGVLLVACFSGTLVNLFLGRSFSSAGKILPWIAGGYAFQNIQQVFESIIYARRKTNRLVVMQGVGTAAAFFLYLFMIPSMGVKGAAVATCISLLVSCIMAVLLAQIHRPIGEQCLKIP